MISCDARRATARTRSLAALAHCPLGRRCASCAGYGGRQVLDGQDWMGRMNLARRDVGTGMTAEACAAFNAQIDIAGLWAYWHAVGQHLPQALTVGGDLQRLQCGVQLDRVLRAEPLG